MVQSTYAIPVRESISIVRFNPGITFTAALVGSVVAFTLQDVINACPYIGTDPIGFQLKAVIFSHGFTEEDGAGTPNVDTSSSSLSWGSGATVLNNDEDRPVRVRPPLMAAESAWYKITGGGSTAVNMLTQTNIDATDIILFYITAGTQIDYIDVALRQIEVPEQG